MDKFESKTVEFTIEPTELRATYVIDVVGQCAPEVGDDVVVKVTLFLPCNDNAAHVLENRLRLGDRTSVFGEHLWSTWGKSSDNGLCRYRSQQFTGETFPYAIGQAEAYAKKEITRLSDFLKRRDDKLNRAWGESKS